MGPKKGPPQQSGQKPASVKIRKKRRRGTREKKSPLQLAFFSCGSWNSRPGFWKRK